MLPSLAVAGAVVKLALSIALTYNTQWWWAPGGLMIAVGVALTFASAPMFGSIVVALGALGFATSAALKPAVAS